jgi:hypothetical protein
MRYLTTVLAVAGMVLLVGGCGGNHKVSKSTTTTTTSTTKAPPPITEGALKGLLLPPEQINAAMGAAEMTVTRNHVAMSDDSDTMEPHECLAVDGASQSQVYADSGFMAVRDQTLQLQQGENFTHYAEQAVVLFPSAKQADAFVAGSEKQWLSCHEYKHTQSGTEWEAAPPTNTHGMLSTVATQENAGSTGWACGRALTAKNNVVIDVNTCSADPKDSAVDIANQIAANVPTSR